MSPYIVRPRLTRQSLQCAMKLFYHLAIATLSAFLLVCTCTYSVTAQGGCTPSPPNSLSNGAAKHTDNTPVVSANPGGTVCTVVDCANSNTFFCFRAEIRCWWSICHTMDSVQCDSDTAAWSVVSG